VDEYLTGNLKANDVLWLVVKGPTAVKADAAAASIVAGSGLEVTSTAGKVGPSGTTGVNPIGQWLGTSPAIKRNATTNVSEAVGAGSNYTTVTADTTTPALRVSLVSNIV
jgi:hypothetical protein